MSLLLATILVCYIFVLQIVSFNLKSGGLHCIKVTQSQEILQITIGESNTTDSDYENLELFEVMEINSNGDYHLKR